MDKYLIFTELFSPTRGGSAVWFDKVYGILGGSDSHILTAKVPGDKQHDTGYPLSVHRLHLDRNSRIRPESLPIYLRFLLYGLLLGLTKKFHSIHAGRVLPEGLIALAVARATRRPCLIYAHGEEITTWTQPAKQKFLKFVYRNTDAIIANSRFTRDLLLNLGVAATRIHLIHPGVDIHQFHPGMDGTTLLKNYGVEGKKIIFSVGRLSRRKGFDHMIEAMPSILDEVPDAHYVLGGIGDDRTYLEEIVSRFSLERHVTFVGKISDDDLPCWYNLCDVFVMANRKVGEDTEGFGMVFIEANACGAPVIAGIEGGTGDAVIDEETGLQVDGTRVDEIAKSVKRILTDHELRDRLGRQGLKRVRENLSWEAVAGKTKKVLESLATTTYKP